MNGISPRTVILLEYTLKQESKESQLCWHILHLTADTSKAVACLWWTGDWFTTFCLCCFSPATSALIHIILCSVSTATTGSRFLHVVYKGTLIVLSSTLPFLFSHLTPLSACFFRVLYLRSVSPLDRWRWMWMLGPSPPLCSAQWTPHQKTRC